MVPVLDRGNHGEAGRGGLRLLEGRVAVLCEGSPFVLTVPHLFMEMFQSAEDPYVRRIRAVTLRCVRFVAWLASLLFLSFYVALETFHQEMIPGPLVISMMAAREGTPFPAAVEVLLMAAAFEILREAGARLPRPVGQAISIVGTLIIGDAAVRAGLVAAQVIIVVAFAAVASFAAPALTQPSVLIRLLALIFTATTEFYGTAVFLVGLLVHLASLRSFGVPYLSTLVPTAVETPRTMPSEPLPVWSSLTYPQENAPRDPEGNRAGTTVGAFTLGTFFVLLVTLPVLGVLGPEESRSRTFAYFSLIRLISIGDFVERVEILHVLIWVLGAFLKLSVWYYLAALATGPR
ncbi:MAG: GerAB/ArcD/ProY family transporter [Bacillota bacterium]